MTSQQVIDIGTRALIVTAKVAGPFLAVVLAVGIVIGLLQSVTQLQEQTLTFVPKLLAVGLVVATLGGWMGAELVRFTSQLWGSLPTLIR